MVGVLKLAAIPNGVPVETMSTHSLRAGGATTMFHAGYDLLEVDVWGRWKSSCFHGYLRYDVQTMRHVGKKMAVDTGLLDFTKIKPSLPHSPNLSPFSSHLSRIMDRNAFHPTEAVMITYCNA